MEGTKVSPKLRRDAQRNRDKLVAAAREVFTERGIDVSLDDIARHAGVGVATAYRHFPEKEQLIDAVAADALARTVALGEEAVAYERAWDGLVFWLTSLTEMQASDAGLRALMKSRSRGADRAHDAHEQIAARLMELTERARAEGDLRSDFELSDIGVVNYMLSTAIDLTDEVQPGTWRRYLGLLLDGMRASRDAPSKSNAPALSVEQIERALKG
ncbi:MAG TPA: helix-turn-helix domain-containing protein [Thermoleophilaceae bacterium]|jgi:AcrR family transcriptional regulator